MVVDPRKMRLRVSILRPTNAKTATGNSKGLYTAYATRYAAKTETGGQNQNVNDQDQATRRARFTLRRDANIVPGWVIRLDSEDWYVQAVPSLDPKDRYTGAVCDKLENLVTVSP